MADATEHPVPTEEDLYLMRRGNLENDNVMLQRELDKYKLFDKFGVEITDGCVVHWTDGGDKLSLEERIATRWDRIAVVSRGLETKFKVIDSPNEQTRRGGYTFSLGSFIWSDTEKYLTVVAESEDAYRAKFSNAGACMAAVLEMSGSDTGEKPQHLTTEAGSTVKLSGKHMGIAECSFDWCEEPGACCDCVVNPYPVKDGGATCLTWSCARCGGGRALLSPQPSTEGAE